MFCYDRRWSSNPLWTNSLHITFATFAGELLLSCQLVMTFSVTNMRTRPDTLAIESATTCWPISLA